MHKIKSFQRNHTGMKPGLYLQETKRLGLLDVDIWDLRFIEPNTESIPFPAIHTIEHLLATELKNRLPLSVLSFCPGGCQTMFYLEIVRSQFDTVNIATFKVFLLECIDSCLNQQTIPGVSLDECGNFKSHDLKEAQKWLYKYKRILEDE